VTRLALVDPETASGRKRELLDELSSRGREIGPMIRGMASSNALLEGCVSLSRAMKRSHLDRRAVRCSAAATSRMPTVRPVADPGARGRTPLTP
jgi:hypothetical protein